MKPVSNTKHTSVLSIDFSPTIVSMDVTVPPATLANPDDRATGKLPEV